MNNTTTTNLTAIVAVFMAATLVVGTFATTPAASAAKNNNNNSGNTVTIQKCKQAATDSGFDNTEKQECQNLICTHPGENATCTQEGAVQTQTPTTPPRTCIECFTSLLNETQINDLMGILIGTPASGGISFLPNFCALLHGTPPPPFTDLDSQLLLTNFKGGLIAAGIPEPLQRELIACLERAGIVFLR